MRYITQTNLIGKKAQSLIESSKVTIVGAGALGTNSAELLTRAGIKELTIIDQDKVELKNLHRQRLYEEKDVKKLKVNALKTHLKKINKNIKINIKNEKLNQTNTQLLYNSDLILDCTDNQEARKVINDYCKTNNIPWIFTAATGYLIILKTVINEDISNLLNKTPLHPQKTGIISPTASIASSLQVSEAIKILTKQNIEKDILRLNLKNNTLERIKWKKQ